MSPMGAGEKKSSRKGKSLPSKTTCDVIILLIYI